MKNTDLPMAPMVTAPVAPPRMEQFVPQTDVCTTSINFVVKNGSIEHVDFAGGCEGNLKGIASMIEGMHVDFVMDRFSGITCGEKSTSCVDQLCLALAEHLEKD